MRAGLGLCLMLSFPTIHLGCLPIRILGTVCRLPFFEWIVLGKEVLGQESCGTKYIVFLFFFLPSPLYFELVRPALGPGHLASQAVTCMLFFLFAGLICESEPHQTQTWTS